jgi:hypothetical protein
MHLSLRCLNVRMMIVVLAFGCGGAHRAAAQSATPTGRPLEMKVELRSTPPLSGMIHKVGGAQTSRHQHFEPGMTPSGIEQKRLADMGYIPDTTFDVPRSAAPIPRLHNYAPDSSPNSVQQNSFFGMPYDSVEPPDVSIAVGPNQIMAVDNLQVRVYDKTGDLRWWTTLQLLFGIASSDTTSDPVAIYDEQQQVFWAIVMSFDNNAHTSKIHVLVSQGPDLQTYGWQGTWLDGSNQGLDWCDYPKLGLDAQALYITCNMFNWPAAPPPNGGSFIDAKILVMTKDEWIHPNGTIKGYIFEPIWELLYQGSTPAFTIQPAVMHGAAASDGEFLAYMYQEQGYGTDLIQITNPQKCCGQYIQAPDFRYLQATAGGASPPPSAQQLGSSNLIKTGDDRLLFANWNQGYFSTGFNANCNGYACAAFLEINNLDATPTVVNLWALQQVGNNYFYPSVDSRGDGYKAIGFANSNLNIYPSAGLALIPPSSICTQCSTPLETQISGFAPYGGGRWGDYYGVARDPDGYGIWVSGEYASSYAWSTQITATMSGYGPGANLSPCCLAFGNQQVGTTSLQQVITLTNTGNSTLIPSSIQATGEFSVLPSSTCSPFDKEPQQSCVINVVFAPTTVGELSGTLYVYDNASSSPQQVSLTGVGVSPSVSIAPLAINFGLELIKNATHPVTVTITNTSGAVIGPLSVFTSVYFHETNTCASGLAIGGSCSVSVSFHPNVTGPIAGSLNVSGGFTGSPATVALNGVGTAVKITPQALTFTGQRVGTTSPAKVITLKNYGGTTLMVDSIVPVGDFGIASNTCGSQVLSLASCTLNVTFTPSAKGTRTGSITFTDGDPASPQVVTLKGIGK